MNQREMQQAQQPRVNDRKEELNPVDRQGRPVRVPIGKQNRLNFKKREGYKRRIVNDVEDGERVKMFENAGWRVVKEKTEGGDTRVGSDSQMGAVVSRSVGGGIKGILMEIPEEYYNEDQRIKQEQINEHERQMLVRPPGFTGEIKIER